MWGENFTIVTLYVPLESSCETLDTLFREVSSIAVQFENTRIVYCGDFNVIPNSKLDANAQPPHEYLPKARRFNGFLDGQELMDVWRALNPNAHRYTCFTHNSYLSRLDLVLASPAMLTHVIDVNIGHAYKSDHSPLLLQLNLSEDE